MVFNEPIFTAKKVNTIRFTFSPDVEKNGFQRKNHFDYNFLPSSLWIIMLKTGACSTSQDWGKQKAKHWKRREELYYKTVCGILQVSAQYNP